MAAIVIVGGGIAGVSCAEELSRLLPSANISLVSGSPLVKAVTNYTKLSRALERFDVEEKPVSYITQLCPNVTVYLTKALSIDMTCRTAKLSNGGVLNFEKLCLCTGASPAVIVEDHPLVLGIRDVESVQNFQEKLKDARRIMVVGNGGIATEIVYEVKGCQIIWAIKDHAISHTFFDEGASTFFLPHLTSDKMREKTAQKEEEVLEVSPFKRTKYALDKSAAKSEENKDETATAHNRREDLMGVALGPDWHADLKMTGKEVDHSYRHVHVEYQTEVKKLLTYEDITKRNLVPSQLPNPNSSPSSGEGEEVRGGAEAACSSDPDSWPLYIEMTNGKVYGCDLVVSATGVSPNVGGVEMVGGELTLEDGGVAVDQEMRTNVRDVYAAGDVCTVKWEEHSRVWFQMRLWTQARQMGAYAARCMAAHLADESVCLDFCFELFAHVTKFFGYKVVLLGLYNAQTLGQDYEIILRYTRGMEYVKVILKDGRMVGAILIGETDLEETFENLILNQMDLSRYGESLLDPRVDIEDYFD